MFGALSPMAGLAVHGLAAPDAPPAGAPGIAPGMPPMLPISDAKGFAPAPAPWLVDVEVAAGGAGAPHGLGMA